MDLVSIEGAKLDYGVQPQANVLLEVSNAMVRIYKEQFGRGPTRARTYWTGPDLLTTVLEDTLTRAERSWWRWASTSGCETRGPSSSTPRPRQFCDPVERITGRTVRAFVSGIDTQVEGLSIEAFVLPSDGRTTVRRSDASSH